MGCHESEGKHSSLGSGSEEEKEVRAVDWVEFHDVFHELGDVAVKLNQLKLRRAALSEKVEALTEEGSKSLERVDWLGRMKMRLQDKQDVLDRAKASLLVSSEQLVSTKEKLLPSAQALLQSARALAGAQKRLQEADRLLNGGGGYGRLNHLRKQLDARRMHMVGQVASLYPLATCTQSGTSPYDKQNQQATADSSLPVFLNPVSEDFENPNFGKIPGDMPVNGGEETSIAIAGLQLVVPVKKQPVLFNERSDLETSATALGYVAHVLSLVSSYMDVPLRYPVRLGASRSHIRDYSPPAEPTIVEVGAISVPTAQAKPAVEFPLFSDNQELTRSAYAVFLLNKDFEQILNRLGIDSVGPRHTLPNLSRLINAITSGTLALT